MEHTRYSSDRSALAKPHTPLLTAAGRPLASPGQIWYSQLAFGAHGIPPMSILHSVIAAHGGIDYWNGLAAIEADISAAGFLFTAKRRPVLRSVRMRAWTTEPRFALYDFPQRGQIAELLGANEVRISDRDGSVLQRRTGPRGAFRSLRHLVFWDDLDFTYFAGYATWNYLTSPFLLARPGFVVTELEPAKGALASLSRLQVTFPDDIPTHSRQQVFYFDRQFLLQRLDYTAEVVGRWAHAAHLCEAYRTFGAMRAPTRRRVLPLLLGNSPLPGPTLVAIEVHDLRPIAAGGAS
jgi:hypothetical protein